MADPNVMPINGPANYTPSQLFNFQTNTHYQIDETKNEQNIPYLFGNVVVVNPVNNMDPRSLASKADNVNQAVTYGYRCLNTGNQVVWYSSFVPGSREYAVLHFKRGAIHANPQYGPGFSELIRFIRNYLVHSSHYAKLGFMPISDAQKALDMMRLFPAEFQMLYNWYELPAEIQRLNLMRFD